MENQSQWSDCKFTLAQDKKHAPSVILEDLIHLWKMPLPTTSASDSSSDLTIKEEFVAKTDDSRGTPDETKGQTGNQATSLPESEFNNQALGNSKNESNETGRERVRKSDPDCRLVIQLHDSSENKKLKRKILYKPNSKDNPIIKNKRTFYHGFYACDIPVIIVEMKIEFDDKQKTKEIERECRILKELKAHENFIRYFDYVVDGGILYIATESCSCSVADILEPTHDGREFPHRKDILSTLTAKEILRQATRGLEYLHQNNFVHRNVKPNNFLIKEINKTGDVKFKYQYVVKITDFRLTRKWEPVHHRDLSGTKATDGWEAPESRILGAKLKKSLDVFILGCFFNYVLTGMKNNGTEPKHPFGDKPDKRSDRIGDCNDEVYQHGSYNVSTQSGNMDDKYAEKLIKLMIQFEEDKRPTLEDVLKDPYFQPSDLYNIYDCEKPGLCVIFNQEKFQSSTKIPERGGSTLDSKALNVTFSILGFEVEVKKDLTAIDLTVAMKELAGKDFNGYGCLVVCLLSHGIENAIVCSDGIYVNINKLKYEFSLNKCPSLYGKPKIFIVQACQGGLKQDYTGIDITSATRQTPTATAVSTVQMTEDESKGHYDEDVIKTILKALNEDGSIRNPAIMDFLTIKSTIPGFVSYRCSSVGSPFIQGLCQVLNEEYADNERNHGGNLESTSISNKVQSKVNEKLKTDWQTVEMINSLSKGIKFQKDNRGKPWVKPTVANV